MKSIHRAPPHISAALLRFAFVPDSGARQKFSQWRLDVGRPTEYYADVYVGDNWIELYERPRNSGHIASRFSGRVDSEIDLVRLLYQVNFIAQSEFEAARMELAPPVTIAQCQAAAGEIAETIWPTGFRAANREEPPF